MTISSLVIYWSTTCAICLVNSPLNTCNTILYTYDNISDSECQRSCTDENLTVERLETTDEEHSLRDTYLIDLRDLQRRICENHGYVLADNNSHYNSILGSFFPAYPALFLLLLGVVFQAAHTGVAGNAVQTRDALG